MRTQYIILLRGINVGGHNTVPMKQLSEMLLHAGFEQVKTYIQTGNIVLFADADPAETIAELITEQFGFTPSVLSLTKEQFQNAMHACPYIGFEGKTVHLYFCTISPTPDRERMDTLLANEERYSIDGNVCYIHAPNGIGRSKLVAKVESCLGVSATGRNWSTVQAISKMLA